MSSKDRKRGAQAPTAAGPMVRPDYMERNKRAFQLLRDYLNGDKSVREEMRVEFDKTREKAGSDWGAINGAIGTLIICQGRPASLFLDVLGGDKGQYFTEVADQFKAAAKDAGIKPVSWSKAQAREILSSLDEGTSGEEVNDPLDFLVVRAMRTETRYPLLRQWAEERWDLGRRSDVGGQIADAIREAKGQLKPSLEDRLASAEKERDTAIENDDTQKLDAADAKIVSIQTKIAERDKPAEVSLEDQLAATEARKADAKAKGDSNALKSVMADAKAIKDQIKARDEAAAAAKATVVPMTAVTVDEVRPGTITVAQTNSHDDLPAHIMNFLTTENSRRVKKLFQDWDRSVKPTAQTVVEATILMEELNWKPATT